jgi:lysophospholipase L1-like esterase
MRTVALAPQVAAVISPAPKTSSALPTSGSADMRRMPVAFGRNCGDSEATTRVLCYGDSLTAGWCKAGAFFCPYGQILAEELGNAEVLVCGLSGRTAEEMLEVRHSASATDAANVGHTGKGLARMLQDAGRQDVALILAGTNDLGHAGFDPNLSAAKILDRVKQLHGICHAAGVRTVALIPPCPMREPFRSMQRELASLMKIWAASEPEVLAHFDVEEVVPRAAAHLWDDEIHMSREGQVELGKFLGQALAGLLPVAQRSASPLSQSLPQNQREALRRSPGLMQDHLRASHAASPRVASVTARPLHRCRISSACAPALRLERLNRAQARQAIPAVLLAF